MSRAAAPIDEERTEVYLRKRSAILGAAAIVFNQKGLKGATLADVAERVGLSGNAITYYYRFKEDLAVDCYLRTFDVLERIVQAARQEADVPKRVSRFMYDWFTVLAEIAEGKRDDLITFYDFTALSRPHVERLRALFVRISRDAGPIVQPDGLGLAPGERHVRPQLLFSIAYGVRNWASRYEPSDYPRAAERVSDILVNGIFNGPARTLPEATAAVPPPPDGRSNSQESFLRAATRLINRQGYRGASVDKIAASLGVTKGSFYHHIDAKDDLVAGCFERSHQIVRDTLRLAAAEMKEPGARLLRAVTALVRYQLSPDGPLLRYTAMSAMPEALRPQVREAGGRLTESLAGIVSDAIAEGSLRAVDAAIAAQVLDTTINAAVALAIWAPTLSPDEQLEAYLSPVIYGLAPAAAPR